MNYNDIDLAGMKILVVDDVLQNIEILLQTLKQKNYQLSFSNSGVEALELAPKLLPDLILLDIMMPEMDGIETCRRLKADEETRDIPVIFITAKADTEDVVMGFEAGGVDYITKPFNLEEVRVRVETHLRLRKTIKDKDALIRELEDTREILENTAKFDFLTNILSRKYLEEEMSGLVDLDEKASKSFSIIIADIDGVGDINELYGRDVGDHVIISSSSILSENLPENAILGRWSSEEFLIFLSGAELNEGREVAEKLRGQFENKNIHYNQIDIPLTMSFGVSQFKTGMNIDEVVRRAEKNLKKSKELGKNKVIASDTDES